MTLIPRSQKLLSKLKKILINIAFLLLITFLLTFFLKCAKITLLLKFSFITKEL